MNKSFFVVMIYAVTLLCAACEYVYFSFLCNYHSPHLNLYLYGQSHYYINYYTPSTLKCYSMIRNNNNYTTP